MAANIRPCRRCAQPITDPLLTRGRWARYCSDECRAAAKADYPKPSVRSLRPGEPVPQAKPRRYLSVQGYVRLRWTIGPWQQVETYEHRVVNGVITNAEQVHHENEVPDDNRPENLTPMTAAEHRAAHRLLDHQRMVALYAQGLTQVEVAARLGCNSATVSRALRDEGVEVDPRRRKTQTEKARV